MNIRPIGDNILVERLPGPVASLYAPNKPLTYHGIELPESWIAKSIHGRVLTTGRGTLGAMGHLIPSAVFPGDIVVFDHRAGQEIKLNSKTILILKESEILCVEERAEH